MLLRPFILLLCALPLWAQEPVLAVRAARFLTMAGEPLYNAVLLINDQGKIQALGKDLQVPNKVKILDLGDSTVCPGFVDLHHHVSAGQSDFNDMAHPLNPELRVYDQVRPSAEAIHRTLSGGVTTTLFIPGSGTFISGFGVLLKMAGKDPEKMILRKLGAMKVAQGFNPERRAGDLGLSRAGSSHLLYQALRQGQDYAQAWRDHAAGKGDKPKLQPALEQLRLVMDRKVPVIIHTAGARDCVATARMFQDVFKVKMILSHGTFNGHWAASALAKRKTPVNLGPRTYEFTKDGHFQGIAAGYYQAGCTDLSLNTDAPVIPPEQLQLQAAMSARLGLPYRASLAALTIIPARQIGMQHRLGSLEPGKDADFIVTNGDPLDPRFPPKLIYIEGKLVYSSGASQ